MLRKGRPQDPINQRIELTAEDDRLLRNAFGRFGGTRAARNEAREAIVRIDEKVARRWIFCDCEAPTGTPILYTRRGDHIVRHHASPTHHEHCDFFISPVQQVRINQSYACSPHNLAYDFLRDRIPALRERRPICSRTTPSQRRPLIARLLYTVLENSGLQTTENSVTPPTLTEQFQQIRKAASEIQLTSTGIRLAQVLSTDASSTDRMISTIERPGLVWPTNTVRHGILIDRVSAVENDQVLFLGGARLPLVGRCSIFGEDAEPIGGEFTGVRSPYLAACLTVVNDGNIQIKRCYLHPMRSNARLSLVDSGYERATWNRIDRTLEESGHIGLSISKPLHDIAPQFGADEPIVDDVDSPVDVAPRPVLIPDFIVEYPAMAKTAIVETMGYADAGYRQRKIRIHTLMLEALMAREPQNRICIIEHDYGGQQNEKDDAFSSALKRFLFAEL